MNQGHKKWMAAVAYALCANAAFAIPMPTNDGAMGGPDASALIAFYGVSLATSPVDAAEDKAVWLAKVQGLISQAPPLFQQSTLASKSKAEFAANLAILESMQKGTLESGANAVKATVAKSAKVSAQGVNPDVLGSANNLVYTALPPCRLMDTRIATPASGVQGPITGNSLKLVPGYILAGTNWGQFGGTSASDCGLNTTVGGAINAVAIVITILNPNFSAYLGVSDSSVLSTVLSTVALNYTGGQGLSTMYIVPQSSNTIYFAMPTGLSANIIFDVVGYFARSEATALECTSSSFTGSVPPGAPLSNTPIAYPACATGYMDTGGYCYGPANANGYLLETGETSCVFRNLGASAYSATAIRRCCRVPGR